MQTLPNPVALYLGRLELALKQKVGVSPEDALSDAREHVCREYAELLNTHPNLSDSVIADHLTTSYGDPQMIADQYEAVAKPIRIRIPGFAPGWRICCTRCGRSAPAAKAGITRVGAFSSYKVIIGWCHDCRWFRWFRLIKDLDTVTLVEKLQVTNTADGVKRRHRPWLALALILVGIAASIYFAFAAFAQ